MKKALIIGTYQNAPYHPFAQVDEALCGALKPAFSCDVTDDPARLARLEACDLLVSYLDAFDSVLPAEYASSILRFVRDGGGLLCLHNGISLQTDERMFHLIGGRFLNHPPQQTLTFTAAPESFLKDCPGFALQEEPYRFAFSGEPTETLLTYTQGGASWPAGWCRREQRGRVAFLTPGHSIRTFQVPAYLDMILRCALWTCGADED